MAIVIPGRVVSNVRQPPHGGIRASLKVRDGATIGWLPCYNVLYVQYMVLVHGLAELCLYSLGYGRHAREPSICMQRQDVLLRMMALLVELGKLVEPTLLQHPLARRIRCVDDGV